MSTAPPSAGPAPLSGLVRVTVASGSRRVDLVLPGAVPVAELVPELALDASDVIVARHHGVTPFTGTALDQTLRNLGVATIVAVGVSLNVGVSGLVMNAVDLGYQVVLPDDAVAGVPVDHGTAIVANSLGLLATVVSTRHVVSCWSPSV